MLNRIHHINLLVHNLDAAVARYTNAFGVDQWLFDELPGRGVRTARFQAGESWIVLVQPIDPEGAPGKYLAEHGEGLFLLSLGVESLEDALDSIEHSDGGLLDGPVRTGLDGWRVADLSRQAFFDAQLQLTEDPSSKR